MNLERKPTFSGKVLEKDAFDILLWASKTPMERLSESWRLHCLNHDIEPGQIHLDRTKFSSRKRS